VKETVEDESIRVETDRPGHPLLVKVAYHPRWRLEGGAGPYLVSPGLMLIVPTGREARLRYSARTLSDQAGLALALAAVAILVAGRRRWRRPDDARPAGATWLRVVVRATPVAIVLVLAALRLLPRRAEVGDPTGLYERASRSYAAERWEEAAELARNASLLVAPADPRRPELLCLEGEALLAAGHPRESALAFEAVVEGGGPHRAQALFSGARAREAAGDTAGAAAWRRELVEGYAGTPWAERLASAGRGGR
jgi:hypothetical protein